MKHMVNKKFTKEENEIWLAGLPKKSVTVKVIIKSNEGKVLLVKPNYKECWQMPGGGVEPGESPKDALVRELGEELDLNIDINKLKLLDTVLLPKHDNLILIYEYLIHIDENQELNCQDGEIEDHRYEEPGKVVHLISDYYSDFWNAYVA